MNLKNDIKYKAGLLNTSEYLNETVFIGSKIFFRNSKRLINFAKTLKRKTEKAISKNKEIDKEAINKLYNKILDTSDEMLSLENIVSKSIGIDKKKAIEAYRQTELKCSDILKDMKKSEIAKALIVIGVGVASAAFIGAIALFFGSGPSMKSSGMITPKIDEKMIAVEASFNKATAQTVAVQTSPSAIGTVAGIATSMAPMALSMVISNLMRGPISQSPKTPQIDQAKEALMALQKQEEYLKNIKTEVSSSELP